MEVPVYKRPVKCCVEPDKYWIQSVGDRLDPRLELHHHSLRITPTRREVLKGLSDNLDSFGDCLVADWPKLGVG